MNIVELIKVELLKRCNESKDSDGFDFCNRKNCINCLLHDDCKAKID